MAAASKPEVPPHFLRQARSWLAIGGALFILAGLALIGWADGAGPSTVSTSSQAPPARTTSSSTKKATPSSTATATETTTTTETEAAGAGPTSVVTTPGEQARGSDTLNIFLLGYGALLLLMFVFYDRISKIVFPGGGEIDLSPLSKKKLVAATKGALPDRSAHEHERALKIALAELSGKYWGVTASPPENVLLEAATHAAATVRGESP